MAAAGWCRGGGKNNLAGSASSAIKRIEPGFHKKQTPGAKREKESVQRNRNGRSCGSDYLPAGRMAMTKKENLYRKE
jgi:hypothetical protein